MPGKYPLRSHTSVLVLIIIILTCLPQTARSQNSFLRGRVCDSLSLSPMPGVIVELAAADGSTLHYTASGEDGGFSFRNISREVRVIRFSILGYRTKTIRSDWNENELGTVLLQEEAVSIEAAVHSEQAFRSSQNGDTLIYNAAAYRTMMGSTSENLIAKMPGISVSSGNVEANGKKVNKIYVDGKEYFDDDVMTALKNIPADLVSQIEVMDKRSDEAELTGMDDGDEFTAINIVTKTKGKTMTSGRLYGGYGLPDKYIAGGSLNRLGRDRSLTVLGMADNISKYNFVSDDLVSASASDGSSSNDANFAVKSLSGISDVQSVGTNYANRWFNGSYMFNRIGNSNESGSLRTRPVSEGVTQLTGTSSDYDADNNTHKFSSKISVSPQGRHSLVIRPSVTYQKIEDSRYQETGLRNVIGTDVDLPDTVFIRNRSNLSDNDRWTVNARLSSSYRYKFSKPGRSLSASLGGSYYRYSGLEHFTQHTFNKEENGFDISLADNYSRQKKDRLSERYGINFGVTYTEPSGKRSRIAIDYKYSLSNSSADTRAYLFDKNAEEYRTEPDNRQSALNGSVFSTHVAGARYNFKNKKLQVTGSLSYQAVHYSGSAEIPSAYETTRNFGNILYNLVGNIYFNRQNTVRISARSSTTNPTVTMLQSTVNLNNLSYIRAGNPELEPSCNHNVETRYIHTDKKKGLTLSMSLHYTGCSGYIGDSLVVDSPDFQVTEGVRLGEGNQYSKPVNLSGYRKISGKFSFGCPLKFISSNLNLNGSATATSVPGMINGDKVPVHRNNYSAGCRIDSNVSDRIDFTLGYNWQYSQNEYSGRTGITKNNYFTQHARGSLKCIIWKGLTFTGSVHYMQNKSCKGAYDDRLTYCDIFLGKKLFRNRLGEIGVGVNDLFDATSRNYRHTISSNGTTDSVDSGIGRYFSVQLVYHLRNRSGERNI